MEEWKLLCPGSPAATAFAIPLVSAEAGLTYPAYSFAATPVDTKMPAPTIMPATEVRNVSILTWSATGSTTSACLPVPSMATWNQFSTLGRAFSPAMAFCWSRFLIAPARLAKSENVLGKLDAHSAVWEYPVQSYRRVSGLFAMACSRIRAFCLMRKKLVCWLPQLCQCDAPLQLAGQMHRTSAASVTTKAMGAPGCEVRATPMASLPA